MADPSVAQSVSSQALPAPEALAPAADREIPPYSATLKPLAVEELADLALHRPLGYLVARACYRTVISPDQLTWASLVVGVSAGAWVLHAARSGASLAPAGALLILSAIVDCSDGQLARMRRTSSTFGRMLDGAVDAIVQAAVNAAILSLLWARHGTEGAASVAVWTALWAMALWSGVQHTSLYDRYKNLYLRHTHASFDEDDDDDDVDADWEAARTRGLSPAAWLRYTMYRPYLRAQRRLLQRVDPAVPGRFRDMPAHSEAVAARYRASGEALMRAWTWFGIGTHILLCGAALMADRVEWYILARVLLWNGALITLIPLQRKASRAFFGAAT